MNTRSTLRAPVALSLALLVLAAGAPTTAATEIGADDFRISSMGGSGNTNYDAIYPAVAYNSTDDELLVVWEGDDDAIGDNSWTIFGQRIDASSGAEVGADDFAVTGIVDSLGGAPPLEPKVAYDSTHNRYLVVWSGNTFLCCGGDYEIFGRLLSAAGVPIGDAFQISHMASDFDEHSYDAISPAVAYNPTADEYLVVWSGDDYEENVYQNEESEIRGQRVSAAGAPIGSDDFRISDVGGLFNTFSDAYDPDVVYNAVDHEYLVVWSADDPDAGAADEEFEIYGQRLDGATGAEIGLNDFRISAIGPAGNTDWFAIQPAVAHDPVDDEYLVVWTGTAVVTGFLTWSLQIFAQRLDGDGNEIGRNDFRITDVGDLQDTFHDAETPAVAYHPQTGQYLVTYRANESFAGQTYDEVEIWGQQIDAATGMEVGPNDFRLSAVGPADDYRYAVAFPALACTDGAGGCLTAWRGDDDQGGMTVYEWEIFGQRFQPEPVLFADGFESNDMGRWSGHP